MRIWDLPVGCLCRSHLLAEHRELHAIWNVVLLGRKGYSRHPEVLRWHGRLRALWERHEAQVEEMRRRGYSHKSPLRLEDVPAHQMGSRQTTFLEPLDAQREKLRRKGCACRPEKGRNGRARSGTY